MRIVVAVTLFALAGAAEAGPRARPAVPSIEGNWRVNFILPMEASSVAPQLAVSEAEAKALAPKLGAAMAESFIKDLDPEFPQLVKDADGLANVRGQWRTRAVVLPADGRLPYTAAARKEVEAPAPPPDPHAADNPEQRPNAER